MTLLDTELLDQIDFSSILEIERATLSKINDDTKKDYLWQRLEELLYNDFTIPQNEEAPLLAFRSLDRKDYERLFNQVLESTDTPVIRAENYRKQRQYANPEAADFVHQSTILMRYIEEDSPILRGCLYVHLCIHFWIVSMLFTNSFRQLVLFADMQSVENLAAQIARIKGIKTVTMQHGLYVDYGSYNTINVVNYRNHNSDYFLAWGPETKALIERYRSDAQVVVCGNPVLEKSKLEYANNDHDYILVVLDQFIFKEQNLEMLRLVSEYGKKKGVPVAVRCHPTDNKETYFTRIQGLIDNGDVSKAKFVVGHTTTLLFEVLAKGIPTLQYVSDIPRINLPGELQFNDVASLEAIDIGARDFAELARHYVEFSGDEAMAEYAKFFSEVF